MKSLLVTLLVIAALPAFAAETLSEPPKEPIYFDHAKVDAAFAKGGMMLANAQFKVLAGRREVPGQVEIHTHDTDVFYVTAGACTILIGGEAVAPKETTPNEWRADKSVGGTPYHLTKGDVLVIPAGVPHWIQQVTPPFLYLVVKTTK